MHFLAFLIAGFSFSIAALLLDNSDQFDDLATLPVLDPPRSDYGSTSSNSKNPDSGSDFLNIKLGSEPNSLNDNLAITTFRTPHISMLSTSNPEIAEEPSANSAGLPSIINPSTFSPEIAQEPSANSASIPSIINPSTFSPNIAQEPSANSAGAPSIIGSSTAGSNKICTPGSIGRKQRKRQACIDLHSLVSRPNLPLHHHMPMDRTTTQENDDLYREDGQWVRKNIPPSADWRRDRAREVELSRPGLDACTSGEDQEHQYPLCCLGPPLGSPVRVQFASLPNIRNCLLFMTTVSELRPFCAAVGRRFCCRTVNFNIMDLWGPLGVECRPMDGAGIGS